MSARPLLVERKAFLCTSYNHRAFVALAVVLMIGLLLFYQVDVNFGQGMTSKMKGTFRPKVEDEDERLNRLLSIPLSGLEKKLEDLRERLLTNKSNNAVAVVKGSETLKQSNSPSLVYKKRRETAHIDCGRILRGDIGYTSQIAANRSVLVTKSEDMSCEQIRKRVIPPISMKKIAFGVAYARVVYKDYIVIEEELRSSYHPQNFFCFSIDKKANESFHAKVKQLSTCIPNVIITPEEFNVDSAGHFMDHAFYECMKLLSKKPGWEYLLLLQNHDIIMKSPYEMVEIYSLLDGANDVEITPCPNGRIDFTMKWDARSLKLFVNESSASPKQRNATIQFAKGATQASVSRAAVDWLVNTVNLTILLNQLNSKSFGVDEILMQSLQISDDLDMPGRFTSQCLEQGKNTDFISRMSHWNYGGAQMCRSSKVRKSICVLGVEDVQLLSKYPNLMANKMLPEFDYGAIECVHEMLFNRTFLGQIDHPLNKDYYRNMVSVKFHQNRKHPKPGYKLVCDANQIEWINYRYP